MTRGSTVRLPGRGTNPPPPVQHLVALLPAKLSPPELAHATVLRPRLLSALSRGVQQSPLTLLSGPAAACAGAEQVSKINGLATTSSGLANGGVQPAVPTDA